MQLFSKSSVCILKLMVATNADYLNWTSIRYHFNRKFINSQIRFQSSTDSIIDNMKFVLIGILPLQNYGNERMYIEQTFFWISVVLVHTGHSNENLTFPVTQKRICYPKLQRIWQFLFPLSSYPLYFNHMGFEWYIIW